MGPLSGAAVKLGLPPYVWSPVTVTVQVAGLTSKVWGSAVRGGEVRPGGHVGGQ